MRSQAVAVREKGSPDLLRDHCAMILICQNNICAHEITVDGGGKIQADLVIGLAELGICRMAGKPVGRLERHELCVCLLQLDLTGRGRRVCTIGCWNGRINQSLYVPCVDVAQGGIHPV